MQILTHMLISFGKTFHRGTFVFFVALMSVLLFCAFSNRPASTPSSNITTKHPDSLAKIDHVVKEQLLAEVRKNRFLDSLTSYALELKGKPYRWGGKSLKGFDCSGFVSYIYEKFGQEVERSSQAQSKQGMEIEAENLQKGDLLFFTGTNVKQKRVGHVGIVTSAEGDEVEFVHSSSKGGVKVSELKGYYESRFLFARRLLHID